MLGKLPVPGRPTILNTVGQGHTAIAVGAGGGCLDIFTLIYPFCSPPSLWETARYRLKYCLKGPLNPKQPNNHLTQWPSFKEIESLHFSSQYSPTNIVKVETLNRKGRNICLRQLHSSFSLDADSSKLIAVPFFLNVFSFLEGTFLRLKYLLY